MQNHLYRLLLPLLQRKILWHRHARAPMPKRWSPVKARGVSSYLRSATPWLTPCVNSQLPFDLPAEPPFELEWEPLAAAIWVGGGGLDASAAREGLVKLKAVTDLSLQDLFARVEASDPLHAELAAAQAAHAAGGGAADVFWCAERMPRPAQATRRTITC